MSAPRVLLGFGLAAILALSACGDDGAPSAAPLDPAEAASQRLDAEAATPRGEDGGATTSTTTTLGEVDPTTIVGAVIDQYSLQVGDCFNRIDELRDGIPATITSRLDCEEPHGYQVFHMLTYPAPHPSVYPGDSIMRRFAMESCYREFEAWVGEAYETSELEIDVLTPNQTNFENAAARYRGIHCWVLRVDGEAMVGDAEGSGW